MASDVKPDMAVQLINTLHEVTSTMKEVLEKAKYHAEDSLKTFSVQGIWDMAAMIGHYCNMYQSLSVSGRTEAEGLCKQFYRLADVRDAFEDLLQVEESWNNFLLSVDSKLLDDNNRALTVADEAPLDVTLLNEKFHQFNAKIVVVTFITKEAATLWAEQTNTDFDMYSDPDKQIYSAIGARRSLAKVWNSDTLCYYADQKAAGRTLYTPLKEDDPHQMGGDFMFNQRGTLLYVYNSPTAHDRPSMDMLLDVCKTSHDDTGAKVN